MALRGEVAHIPLSNIFQTLSLSRQEGVLEVSWRGCCRRLRFINAGVRVIPDKPASCEPLRSALIKQRILSEAQFTNVQKTLPPTVVLLDALHDRRVLTTEQIAGPLQDHFYELALDVFCHADAHFNFAVEGDGASGDFVARPDIGQSLTFEVTALLMESARRDDEWARIRGVLASGRDILAPVEPRQFAEHVGAHVACHELGEDLLHLIDGERSLDAVVEASRFSVFQIFTTVCGFVEAGILVPLAAEQKRELAKKHRRHFRFDEAADVYRSLLDRDPQDRESRKNLVAILERQEKVDELAVHWRDLAASAVTQGDLSEAKEFLEKVLARCPEDLDSLLALSRVQKQNDRLRDAVQSANRLVSAARTHRDPAAALAAVAELVAEFPNEFSLRHELARMHYRSGDEAAALAMLRELAEHYAKIGSVQNLRKTYEQIMKINPEESHAFEYILAQERRHARRRARSLKFLAVKSAIFLAFCAIAFVGVHEFRAYRAYATTRDDTARLIGEGKFDEARTLAEAAAADHRLSVTQKHFSDLVREIENAHVRDSDDRQHALDQRTFDHESKITRARVLEARNQYDEAVAVIRTISRDDLDPKLAAEADALLARLTTYLEGAKTLASKAREAEAQERWRDAYILWRQLHAEFPSSPEARRLRYPLKIHTVPPNAEVWLDGVQAGLTPYLARWPGDGRTELILRKRTYAPLARTLSQIAGDGEIGWSLAVSLKKLASWRYACGAVVEAATMSLGDRTFIANRGGTLHAVDSATGAPLWQLDLGEIGGVSAALRAWNGRVVCVTVEGTLFQVSRDGSVLLRHELPIVGPIKVSPSLPTEDGMLVIVGDGGTFCGMSLEPCAVRWQGKMPARISASPAGASGRLVMIADTAGNLWECSITTGEILAKHRMPHPITVPPLPLGEHGAIVAAGPEVSVYRRMRTEELQVKTTLPARILTLQGSAHAVHVSTDDEFLTELDSSNLALVWKSKLPAKVHTMVQRSEWIYAAGGAEVLAITPQGRVAWSFACKDRIWALEVPDDDHLLVGGEDRAVLLFDLAPDFK